MAKSPHRGGVMRVFYPVWQVTELAAGYRYTTAAFNALIKQTSGEILNRPKDFVAFALATGGHLRLPATACPGITQGAPLGKAGFVFKQDQPFAALGCPDNRRPLILQPSHALRRVQMIRHKTGLLERKSQVVQQRADIMAIVEDTKFAPDQHADHDRVPTGRLQAHHQWASLDQLHQAFFLAGGQLFWTPAAVGRVPPACG